MRVELTAWGVFERFPTLKNSDLTQLLLQNWRPTIKPKAVVPAMPVLASQDAPNRTILCAGGGTFEAAHITLTQGLWLGSDAQIPERLAERLAEVTDRT